MNLSEPLLEAIDDILDGHRPGELALATRALSQRYRAGQPTGSRGTESSDALAYAAYRMPATYAAVHSALVEVRRRQPAFEPETMLDIGAGPGTASWAGTDVWQSLRDISAIEPSLPMAALGRRLARTSTVSALRNVRWIEREGLSALRDCSADLVVAAYVLGEVLEESRDAWILELWRAAKHTLVLVEPGTPLGFGIIHAARDALLNDGAHMVAPCPHEVECPLATRGDWCHFSERLARTRVHRRAKSAELPYEDEKFSYLAVSRRPADLPGARVVRHPLIRSGHIYLDLCTPGGLERRIVSRRDKNAFRAARNTSWGDTFGEGTQHSAEQ